MGSITPERVAWAAVAFGIVLRTAEYLLNNALYVDEAALALNVTHRKFAELFLPLDFNQAAPGGFLVLEKLAVLAFRDNEFSLRIVPFCFAISSVVLFYQVARRVLSDWAIPIATLFFASSGYLIHFAAQVKQYSSDVCISLIVVLIAIDTAAENLGPLRATLFGLLGAIAVWLSYPSVFALAGSGITLSVVSLRQRNWRKLLTLGCCGATWLASFAVLFAVSLRTLSENQRLESSWLSKGTFMPLPPRSASDLGWFARAFVGMFSNPTGSPLPVMTALLFLAGCVYLFYKNWTHLMMIVSPLLLTMLASGIHKYPFGRRLLLFAVPLIVVVVSAALEYIIEYRDRLDLSLAKDEPVATPLELYFRETVPALTHEDEIRVAKTIERANKRIYKVLSRSWITLYEIRRLHEQLVNGEMDPRDIVDAPTKPEAGGLEQREAVQQKVRPQLARIIDSHDELIKLRESVEPEAKGSDELTRLRRSYARKLVETSRRVRTLSFRPRIRRRFIGAIDAVVKQIRTLESGSNLIESSLATKQSAEIEELKREQKALGEALRDLERKHAVPAEEIKRIHQTIITAETQVGEAEREMVEPNLGLVISIARKYARPGVNFLDLVQEGNVGLFRAVATFDWRRGDSFAKYAASSIRREVTRALPAQPKTALYKGLTALGILVAAICELAFAAGGLQASHKRLLVFALVTLSCISIAVLLWAKRESPAPALIAGAIIAMLLLLRPLAGASNHLLRPGVRQDIRPVLAYVRDHLKSAQPDGVSATSEEPLYVYHHLRETFQYYAPRFGLEQTKCHLGTDERSRWKAKENDAYLAELDQLRENKRVWLLFGFVRTVKGVNEEHYMTKYLDETGSRVDFVKHGGASAYLYAFEGQQRR